MIDLGKDLGVRSDRYRIGDRNDAFRYVIGGKAVFTLVSRRTRKRYTYRISQGRGKVDHLLFVSVLTGPDNTRDYTFLGTVFPCGSAQADRYRHGSQSSIKATAQSALAFTWFWRHALVNDETFMQVELWHHGRCSMCNRPLTDPESINRGIGPVCAEKQQAELSYIQGTEKGVA